MSFTKIALIILFGLQLLFMIVKPRSVVLNTSYTTSLETGTVANQFKPVVTTSFQVNGPAALEIDLSAQIDNQWVELPVSLINETTGQSYEFTKALEYYHGYEGGESWTEGSTSEEAELARIPSGRYHVNLYPIAEGMQAVSGTVKITQNPMLFSNLLIVAVLLLIYPIYLYFKRQSMEYSRWQNSDFSDYQSDSD